MQGAATQAMPVSIVAERGGLMFDEKEHRWMQEQMQARLGHR